MTSQIPYNFKFFEDVPVEYLSDTDIEKAIAMDLIIPVAKEIQKNYNMSNVVNEVVRRNQEAINLMNSSSSDDDLYPEANDFEGNDNDYLDQLHNMMDQEGDIAHDRDWEEKPSFANNTPENRWRDLRQLADSTFTNDEMEEVVKRKRNNNAVEHDLQAIEKGINERYSYVSVDIAPDEPTDLPDNPEEELPGEEDGSDSENGKKSLTKGQKIVIGILLGIVLLVGFKGE